ncbi:alpha tubulin suppressor [Diatrype stigma]|uniref:Alpha tubulin suppressor n=1 Tax=Diatrype stigma TaxID=117547 RepID=A0AAN9YQX8_9PEZI
MEGLFALGSNGSGQLGIGHKEDVSVPKPVLFDEHHNHPLPGAANGNGSDDDDIVKIAAGGNHTILVTKRGKAYWSGDPSTGACGIVVASAAVASTPPVFREVVLPKAGAEAETETETEPLPGPVADVACTWDSSVFALRDAEGKATKVYSCGGGGGGSGRAKEPIPSPLIEEIAGFPPPGSEIRHLAAGFRHVVAVLDNGDVYGWGHGRKGQLGVGTDTNPNPSDRGIVPRPTKIEGVGFPVARAVCCQHATCLIAEPGDGRVVVLGADKWGLRSAAPAAVPNWKAVAAGWGAVYVLRYDGVLEAWGRDDHGQLPPPGVPRIASVAAGSEHVVALTADTGEVISWGWGEHGNCGPQQTGGEGETSGVGDVKGRWNTIASLRNLPEGSDITLIGAGCATSWIQIAADGIFL